MKKYGIAWVIGFLLIAWVTSCTEAVVPTPYTYTKVFTGEHSKTWKAKFFEQTLDGTVVQTFAVSCMTDDLFTFTANSEHSYKVATGSKKCNTSPAEGDVILDTWAFVNPSATLQIILPVFDPANRTSFIVREAKKNGMVLEIFFDATGKESYRIHFEVTSED
jgi:hypothetical protein